MIEQADARLTGWIVTVVGDDVEVTLAPPADGREGAGVSLFLMDLVAQPALRGERRSPLQLALRYLVTTWAPEPSEQHRLLGALVLAAMQEEDFQVQLAPMSAEAWTALRAAPRPSFVLHLPLRLPRPEPVVPRVRGPMVVRGVGLAEFSGLVVGPGDLPVAGARVEVPSAGAVAETDVAGRFTFPGLPLVAEPRLVRVRARGREMEVEMPLRQADLPVVIRFDQLLED